MTKLFSERKILVFFLGFLVLRIVLFNFNLAEWGDSYSILRMAEFLRDLKIPLDEKRLPLFSLTLIPGFFITNPVFWGRLVVLISTFLVLFFTLKIHRILFPKSKYALLVLTLTLFNPIFLYWSIRIMADIPFAVFALGSILTFYKKRNEKSVLLVALLVGLASLTRFEGFLLVPGFMLYFFLKKDFISLATFLTIFTFIVAPWFVATKFLLQAQASSAYLKEASGFIFDFKRFRFFILSYIFAFGFAPAFLYYILGLKKFLRVRPLRDHLPLLSFLALETVLAFYWTPSVPRILLPIVPIMTIFFVEGLFRFFKDSPLRVISAGLVVLYLYGQYVERTHFLVLSKVGFLLVAGFSVLALISRRSLLIFVFLSLFISNFVILVNHRYHYFPTLNAAEFAKSLNGKVSYSDETGVSKWVLDRAGVGISLPRHAVQFGDIHKFLRDRGIKYIVWSNEFERFSSFWWIVDNEEERSHFKLIKREQVDVSDKLDSLVDKMLGTNLVDKRWVQEARVYEYVENP